MSVSQEIKIGNVVLTITEGKCGNDSGCVNIKICCQDKSVPTPEPTVTPEPTGSGTIEP